MKFSISIVSHCSGELVAKLLSDLRNLLPPASEIIITINVKEDEAFLAPYNDLPIIVLRNEVQRGFGSNHNQAFGASSGRLFVVVNPDVRLDVSPFVALEKAMSEERVGACAPVVLSPIGHVEDSVRQFPTLRRLAIRVLLRRSRYADYPDDGSTTTPVDWAAGMFVVFARDAFAAVGGFDTRYFMYLEDADICRRLWTQGWSVVVVHGARVVHDARRASHKSPQHLKWHLRSALRFLLGI